jgi:branched-chain amino acid transport system substrate-binding protein
MASKKTTWLRSLGIVAGLAVATSSLVGCSASLGGDTATGDVIKIGYVTPQTGPLAAFGEADSYVLDQMATYYKDNGVTLADGSKHSVEIISKDTQSDSKRAADVASELILKDGVSMILVSSTPDTVNPVSDQCEANQVVCISTVAPWQAYFFGRGGDPAKPFKWTYHFFWGLEDISAVYTDMWKQSGTTSKSVGELWPNDPDGQAWSDKDKGFPPAIAALGLSEKNPGLYPNGTTDFSAQISAFKSSDSKILLGVPIPPDFTTFWKQAVQQGYQPEVATIGKAILFPSALEALGKTGNNLSSEVWWSPSSPYSSKLTGQSAADLAAAYEKSTSKQWTQPLGFAEALFEVATAMLQKSASLKEADLQAALSTLKTDTIVGPVDFTSGPVPNVSKTPLVGGQWRLQADGTYQVVIVSNSQAPQIPLGGKMEKIVWSK